MSVPKQVQIRPAADEDVEAICAIYDAAIADRESRFETAARVDEDFAARIGNRLFPMLVCEVDEEVVGWAALARYSADRCEAWIAEYRAYVAAPVRRRGVGTALTESLALIAEELGFGKRLVAEEVPGARLLERCGFAPVGPDHGYGQVSGLSEEQIVLERPLGPPEVAGT